MTDAVAVPSPRPHGVTRDLEEMSAVESRHMVLIDQMIAWSIANPGKPWTDCARALGVSTLWARMVASSDAFKARYSGVKNDLIQQCGIATLKDKINAAAEVVVERIADKAVTSESMEDLVDAAEVLLGATYGKGGAAGTVVNTTVQINADVIREARAAIIAPKVNPAPEGEN